MVEIARALATHSRTLILDEPNSALNAAETDRLFAIVRQLRDEGVAVILVSHRLSEVFAIADEVTVLRNGRVVSHRPISETSMAEVVREMTGRTMEATEPLRAPIAKGAELRLAGVTVRDRLSDVTFEAAAGEVVGLAGLEGSGVADVFAAVFGSRPPDAGTVVLPSGRSAARSIPGAVHDRVAYVPPDRRISGLMLAQTVAENLNQVTAGALARFGFFLSGDRLRHAARARMESLNIIASSADASVISLSGGNQQKVLLGKWLEADPEVVLLNDPTRGVDVGSKAEIYVIIRELASEGRVVLFASSENSDYFRVCDRILIFYRGRVVGSLPSDARTEEGLLHAINTGLVDSGTAPQHV
jgi:ribose transport system ATP-binding protein